MRWPLALLLPGCADDHLLVLTEGAAIPVEVRGDLDRGSVVVFESGGPSGPGIAERTAGGMDWALRVEPEVAVAFYDRRGVGNADGDYTVSELSFERLVDDLSAVIAALRARHGFERVVLVGHSFGTKVVIAHADQRPDESDGIGLVAPVPFGEDAAYVPYRRDFACRVAAARSAAGEDDALWTEILDWCALTPIVDTRDPADPSEDWRTLSGYLDAIYERLGQPEPLDVGGVLAAVFASHYGPVDTLLRANRVSEAVAVEGQDLLPELSFLQVPALVVAGEYDDIAPLELALVVHEALGSPEEDRALLEQPGAGHAPWDPDPQPFADAVLDLVERAEAR